MWPFKRRTRQAEPGLVIDPCAGDPAARELRAALERRDWRTARDLLTGVRHPDDRAFYLSICADVPGLQDWIGEWVDAEPDSTLPLLVRGCHAVYWAWQARGGASADNTSQSQFQGFFSRLKLAENCLDEVVARDPDEVTAWSFLVTSARGRQVDRAEAERRFAEVVRRHPTHVAAHEQMLQYLCEKWFGSHEEMFDFARTAMAKAPAGSLVPQVVAAAHIERWLSLPSEEKDPYIMSAEVRAELRDAAERSIWHPDYVQRPGWPSRFNTFALAFAFAEDFPSAARVFDAIGDHATEWPWYYSSGSDPAGRFAYWRAYSYERRDQPPS